MLGGIVEDGVGGVELHQVPIAFAGVRELLAQGEGDDVGCRISPASTPRRLSSVVVFGAGKQPLTPTLSSFERDSQSAAGSRRP